MARASMWLRIGCTLPSLGRGWHAENGSSLFAGCFCVGIPVEEIQQVGEIVHGSAEAGTVGITIELYEVPEMAAASSMERALPRSGRDG